jgi:hypothetical protein
LALALALSFSAALGLSIGMAATFSSGVEPSDDVRDVAGTVVNRVEVARATFPGAGGTDRVLYGEDAFGTSCVAIATPAPKHTAMAEGCGGPEQLNIGQLTAPDGRWTILVGRVSESVSGVTMTETGRPPRKVDVIQDEHGISGKFVLQKVGGAVDNTTVVATGPTGDRMTSQELR